MRICRIAGLVVLSVGLGFAASPDGAGAAEGLPPLVTTLETVLDGVGDVLDTVTSSLFDEPGADITAASLEYAPGWIRMKTQLKHPINPLRDPQWSDNNTAEWLLDTNGDGVAEYTVEFSTDEGELYGAIFDLAKPDEMSICDADSASYSTQDGYTLVIDPACIGHPKSLSYAVMVYIDTDPRNEDAPAATDRVPDQGFKTVAAPVQPTQAAAPAAPAPTAPGAAPVRGAPAPTPVSPNMVAGPGAMAAPSVPTTRAGAAAAPAARPAVPSREASPPPVGAPGTIPAAAPPAAVDQGRPVPDGSMSASVPPDLARTGSASGDRALLGLGVMLLGAGMLVMTRPTHRVRPLA